MKQLTLRVDVRKAPDGAMEYLVFQPDKRKKNRLNRLQKWQRIAWGIEATFPSWEEMNKANYSGICGPVETVNRLIQRAFTEFAVPPVKSPRSDWRKPTSDPTSLRGGK